MTAPATPDAARVAFLGLGIMGTPMARNLLRAGYRVTVYNRSRAKAEALAAEGAAVAETPAAAAAAADVVCLCLADAAAVEAVITGPDGVLETIGGGQTVIDFTTNNPPVSIELAALLRERGADWLDAPVSGGDVGAIEGTLSIMVGGAPATFERCLPVLQTLGGRVTLMGETVGAGGYAKLANQIMVAINLASLGEALAFGARAGLDVPKLMEALAGGLANSEVLRIKGPKILSGQLAPGGAVTVQLKDLRYVADSLAKFGGDLPVTRRVQALYEDLVREGFADEDHSAIVRTAEAALGTRVRGTGTND